MLNAGNSIILTLFSYSRCRIIMISLRSKIKIQTTEMINIRHSLHTRQGRRLALPSLTLCLIVLPCLALPYLTSHYLTLTHLTLRDHFQHNVRLVSLDLSRNSFTEVAAKQLAQAIRTYSVHVIRTAYTSYVYNTESYVQRITSYVRHTRHTYTTLSLTYR